MRVLITCIPQTGHIVPLLPLAEALAAAGDDVRFASGPDAETSATNRGLAFHEVGPGFGEWFAALRARTRGMPGDGLAPDRIEGYFLPRLFGEVGMALMVDDLLELGRRLEPDLVVFDPLLFAGPLVAALLGVPGVHHTVGPVVEPHVLDLVADAVSPIWREFGLDVPPAAGIYAGTTLAICPPSLDPGLAALPHVHPLRPVPPPRRPAPTLPVELPRPGCPLIYVTLGTFSNSDVELFRLLLRSLSGQAVNLVVTVGRDNDPADLAPLPDNAVVERFIPQDEVLPHCAAAVHHAGAGTAFGVVAHGLPSVVLPQSADNFRIGARLAEAGVAHVLMPGDVDEVSVAAALARVLDDEAYRRSAESLAAELAAMPAPDQVAEVLRRG